MSASVTFVSVGDRLPGAETTMILRSGSSLIIAKTFSNCWADAKELPPNFVTFICSPVYLLNIREIIAEKLVLVSSLFLSIDVKTSFLIKDNRKLYGDKTRKCSFLMAGRNGRIIA